MDRDSITRIVLAAAIILGLFYGYSYLKREMAPETPPEAPPAEATPAETPPAEAPPAETPPAEAPPAETPPAEAPPAEAPPETPPAGPEIAISAPKLVAKGLSGEAAEAAEPVVLGSAKAESPYALEAEIVPAGGGVGRLALARSTGFFETVADRYLEDPNARAAMALVGDDAPYAALTIPELRVGLAGSDATSTVDLSGALWRLERRGTTEVAAEVDVATDDGKPVLTVRKVYTLFPWAADGEAELPPYSLGLRLEIVPSKAENAARPRRVQVVLGTAPPLPREGVRQDFRQAVAGTWTRGKFEVERFGGKEFKAEEGAPEGAEMTRAAKGEEVAWAGTVDKYFAVVVVPAERAEDGSWAAPERSPAVGARAFQVPGTAESGREDPQAGIRLILAEQAVGTEAVVQPLLVFAGPKDPEMLETGLYGALNFETLIVWTRCCFAFPGLESISKAMTLILNALYTVVRNYGIAIIILVILLRAALHPVTRWSTKSMSKMQRLGPKMKQLREQFGDDKQRLNQEMMKLYKEEGINPVGSCLPMFIQMPIWIGLYGALMASLQLRHAAFIPSEWVPAGSIFLQDLAQPDSLVHWVEPFFLPGRDILVMGWVINAIQGMLGPDGITSFNILPFFMAGSMFLQQRLTPQTATGPQAEQQKKMMGFMMIFMLVILYNAPAGLTLYIFVSSLIGFGEQRYLKQRYAEAAGPGGIGDEPPALPRKKTGPAYVSGKPRSLTERIRQRIAPETGKSGKKRK